MVKYSKKQNEFMDAMFSVLSDKTRRDILEKVSRAKRLSVGEIAQPYVKEKMMSLPAVSKHIKILGQSNLVKIKTKGRMRIVIANPVAIKKLGRIFEFYNKKLDIVEEYLTENTKSKLKQS